MTCVLCAMATGDAPADIHYADADVIAIVPLRVMAPVHLLLFTAAHYRDLPELLKSDPALAGKMMSIASDLATERSLDRRGFRLTWNYGPDTSQKILHPHVHLLGGRPMKPALA